MVRFPHACISRLHPKSGLSCLYKFGECLKDDQSWGRLISTLPFLITGGKFEISRRSNFVRVVPPALLAYLVEEPRDNNLEAWKDYKPAKLQTISHKSLTYSFVLKQAENSLQNILAFSDSLQ